MIKIFPIYYSGAQAPAYRSDCFEPVMAGADPHWAELTAHEKIMKEWLPNHPDEKYVGFCHYRRFPDFWRKNPSRYLSHAGFERFHSEFSERYAEARILPTIDGYDIIVPCPSRPWKGLNNYQQYLAGGHPPKELDKLIAIVRRFYPEMVPDLEAYLNDTTAYLWLQFIMRRDWFEEYLNWQFDVLRKLEQECDWCCPEYDSYPMRRVPAFLAERFVNVFVRWKVRTCAARVLERQCIFLVPDEECRPLAVVSRYLRFFFEKALARFGGRKIDKMSSLSAAT